MAINAEVKLQLIDDKYDIDFDSSTGDFVVDEGLDTAILMSLLLNKRADESEVIIPTRRDGYWAIDITGMEFSKLWLVNGRLTQDKLNQAIEYCNSALNWLIEDNLASNIETTAQFTKDNDINKSGIQIFVTITKLNNVVETKNYILWLNTSY